MVELEWVMWNQWINYHQSRQEKSTAHDKKKNVMTKSDPFSTANIVTFLLQACSQ